MTNRHLARPGDAVANQRPVVTEGTTERRRSIGAAAQTRVDLEGAVDQGVRLVKQVPPTHREDA